MNKNIADFADGIQNLDPSKTYTRESLENSAAEILVGSLLEGWGHPPATAAEIKAELDSLRDLYGMENPRLVQVIADGIVSTRKLAACK
jgi:hypothetical protein